MSFTFSSSEPADMIAMAAFCGQLVREGIVFTSKRYGNDFVVTLTGGY